MPSLRYISPQLTVPLQGQIGQGSFVVQLNRLNKRLIWSKRSQCSSHVRIYNLESVNITGIDPAESITFTLAYSRGILMLTYILAWKVERLTLPSQRP